MTSVITRTISYNNYVRTVSTTHVRITVTPTTITAPPKTVTTPATTHTTQNYCTVITTTNTTVSVSGNAINL